MKIIPHSSSKKILSKSDEKLFQLVEINEMGTFIYVLCGGVGMYTRIIKLNDHELKNYSKHGINILNSLAYKIAKGEFEEREYKEEIKK